MAIRLATWKAGARVAVVESFLQRPAFDPKAESVARRVLDAIRREGAAAMARYMREFDGVTLAPRAWAIPERDRALARREIRPSDRRAILAARARIAAFARAGLKRDWSMRSPGGGRLGEKFVPYERVGVYVPGGQVPLVSTALMTCTLAQVAGVREIVACTPCDREGRVNPKLIYALEAAGATQLYRVGGIQAIGLMAYGTKGIPKVQKIVGPGGPYVTAAKRLVYGQVALDLVAGPSEIAVLSDGSVPAAYAAADLLSQAEHGTGWEKALLITTSRRHADAVRKALDEQLATLPRAAAVHRVIDAGGILLTVTPTLDDAIALCNRFAPEHLELLVRQPRRLLPRIRCAGAVFLGPWTPESAGDFVAGPSHVLPTGGAAALFSGLTVDDFRRRSSVIELTRGDLKRSLPVIEAFGAMEGLEAHARSARLRFP
jgi:histidinol dehydrogenase